MKIVYDTEVWLSKDGKTPFPANQQSEERRRRTASFSPDGQWIAFLSDRGNKNQIHVIRTDGGEARAVTKEEEGVTSYEWHPSGRSFIFVKPEKRDKNKKEEGKRDMVDLKQMIENLPFHIFGRLSSNRSSPILQSDHAMSPPTH